MSPSSNAHCSCCAAPPSPLRSSTHTPQVNSLQPASSPRRDLEAAFGSVLAAQDCCRGTEIPWPGAGQHPELHPGVKRWPSSLQDRESAMQQAASSKHPPAEPPHSFPPALRVYSPMPPPRTRGHLSKVCSASKSANETLQGWQPLTQ